MGLKMLPRRMCSLNMFKTNLLRPFSYSLNRSTSISKNTFSKLSKSVYLLVWLRTRWLGTLQCLWESRGWQVPPQDSKLQVEPQRMRKMWLCPRTPLQAFGQFPKRKKKMLQRRRREGITLAPICCPGPCVHSVPKAILRVG